MENIDLNTNIEDASLNAEEKSNESSSETIPDKWKKVKLADGTIFYVVEYENEQLWDKVKLVLGNTTYDKVKSSFTQENCSDVIIMSDIDDQVIAELFNKKLGNEITINFEVDQITIHLENYAVEAQISTLANQLEQTKADIDFLTIMADDSEVEE